jgi:hypothetical protein
VIAWRAAADIAVRGLEVEHTTSVLLCDARLHVQVKSDAAKDDLIRALSDLGIPETAYVPGPDEPNVRGSPTIGLPSFGDPQGVGVSLPVSSGTVKVAGELTLGLADMRVTTHMLHPCPGHGPPEEQPTTPGPQGPATISDQLGETTDWIHYAYIPAQTSMQLGFNERAQLVALTYLTEKGQEELEELIDGISGVIPLRRAYADDRIVLLIGETGSILVALGAQRDWYDKPYRISVSCGYVPGSAPFN